MGCQGSFVLSCPCREQIFVSFRFPRLRFFTQSFFFSLEETGTPMSEKQTVIAVAVAAAAAAAAVVGLSHFMGKKKAKEFRPKVGLH